MLAVLQEMLALPQTPPSLVSLLTEKLLTLIPDDSRRIQTVSVTLLRIQWASPQLSCGADGLLFVSLRPAGGRNHL